MILFKDYFENQLLKLENTSFQNNRIYDYNQSIKIQEIN